MNLRLIVQTLMARLGINQPSDKELADYLAEEEQRKQEVLRRMRKNFVYEVRHSTHWTLIDKDWDEMEGWCEQYRHNETGHTICVSQCDFDE